MWSAHYIWNMDITIRKNKKSQISHALLKKKKNINHKLQVSSAANFDFHTA